MNKKSITLFLIVFGLIVSNLSAQTNYYVSKDGNDSSNGSSDHPFLTISKAASVTTAGDTVFIHAGTYEEVVAPANSGSAGQPIVFQSFPGEKVVVSAMQALSGWTLDYGQIYKTIVDWSLGQENFVMNGAKACDLARWPNNEDGEPFTLNSKRNTGGSSGDVIYDAYLTSSEIPNYDWSQGGSVFFYCDKAGAGWTAWKAFIKNSSAGKVLFDLNKNPDWIRTVHPPAGLGDFYLEGIKEALDYQNEWYFDEASKTLYIQLPGGSIPIDGEVKMRKRKLTFDLKGKNYIEVRNLAVFGGSIEIQGSNNTIYGVKSLYGSVTRGVVNGFRVNSQAILINSGDNNTIEKCEVGYGNGSGVWDAGTNSKILNNYIHDFDYAGTYDAVLMVRNGSGSTIKYNTIKRGGRDCIQIISKNSEVAYNDVSESNLIADDCGLLYTIAPNLNMEIHHNLFHDTFGRGSLYKSAGIYLDNDASNVKVHHNVVWNCEWSAIQQNKNCANNDIFNNTLINCSAAMDAWHAAGTSFTNVRVWNNLSNMNSFEEQADKQNNLYMALVTNVFTDMAGGNFTLRAGTAPIDFGRVIDGITDGYVGANPDVGAYEFGAVTWVAGIDWEIDAGPTGLGCYGLPGEQCSWPTANEPKFEKQQPVTFFPNPVVKGKLNITIGEHFLEEYSWQVHAMTGQLVLGGTANENFFTIDLESQKPGIYLVTVWGGSQRFVEKVIKK